jgi:hypothetical protein
VNYIEKSVKKHKEQSEYLTEESKSKSHHELSMIRFKDIFELELARIENRHKLKMAVIENDQKKRIQNLENILKGIYHNNIFEIFLKDKANIRDCKLKIKDLVKKREMNEKEIGSKKVKLDILKKKQN